MSERSSFATGCPADLGTNVQALLRLSFVDAEVAVHPTAFYRALRIGDPVHYDEKLGMYLVSRHEDLAAVLRDPVTFSQRGGWDERFGYGHFEELKSILIRDGGGFFPETLQLDPPQHARIRRLTEKAFTAHRVKQLEPSIQQIVAELIDRVADKGQADGVSELASPLTIQIMCEQLGFDFAEVGEKIVSWAHAYVAQVGTLQTREEMLHNAQQICELQNYIIARLRERQAEPREDMMSDLIGARLEDEENPTLSFEELVATTRGLINGGSETTATGLTHMLFLLATRPDIAAHLRERLDDDQQVARFVEELLRLHPPARALPRMTTREVELGGQRLPAGAQLLMLFGSANDDEEVFDCPRDFDMGRRHLGRHLSFGAGVHICVGMSLARMELKTVARELLRRLDDIKLAVPVEEVVWQPGIATLTAKSLPLSFSRR